MKERLSLMKSETSPVGVLPTRAIWEGFLIDLNQNFSQYPEKLSPQKFWGITMTPCLRCKANVKVCI
jgi:hypothetical protein